MYWSAIAHLCTMCPPQAMYVPYWNAVPGSSPPSHAPGLLQGCILFPGTHCEAPAAAVQHAGSRCFNLVCSFVLACLRGIRL